VNARIKAAIRSCLTQPHAAVLLGTTLPPFNVLWAAGFWLVTMSCKMKQASVCARSLNVQLTYTLLLAVPFVVGERLTHRLAPGSSDALAAGVTLGLIGALGVLLLVFFNTRALAEDLLHKPASFIPRLKVVSE
jgi:hypothetical protein